MNVKSQRGVALVITLIMVAIITLLAVSFLALSRRDQASISVSQSDTVSRLAAEAAEVHAQAEVIARVIAASNSFGAYSSFVGYSNYLDSTPGVFASTNIDYIAPLNRMSAGQFINAAASLQMDARVPVFIKRPQAGGKFTSEERYYLDFNRNGTNDSPGWNFLTNNYYAGDPEWIGVLEHPEFRHSGTNRFVARYAYLVLPAGNCLDLNYIHNYARGANGGGGAVMSADAFSRNQGVGGWEVNLAAFLQDLAPDFYPAPGTGRGYSYTVAGLGGPFSVATSGWPFQNAFGLLQYRYANRFNNLASVNLNLQFNNASIGKIFQNDFIDSYSINPVLTAPFRNTNDVDQPATPWAGSPAPGRFVDMQDLFTKLTTSSGLANVTNIFYEAGLSTGPRSTPDDRYLLYRLLSQLSTGSEPELKGKINLNFTNDPGLNTSQTTFTGWAATNFFKMAAQAILQANMLVTNAGLNNTIVASPFVGGLYSGLTNAFIGGLSVATNFGVTNIEIYPSNQYTPVVRQLLQIAANLYDSACTNRVYPRDPAGLGYPTVFRPILARGNNSRIYIRDWVEVGDANNDFTLSYLMNPAYTGFYNPDPVSLASVNLNSPATFVNGVPWIIGAKKGFPNFNELLVSTSIFAERKVQLKRPQAFGGAPNATNQMYVLAITNTYGVEAWNSYTNAYPPGHTLKMTMVMQSTAMLTNAAGTIVWPVNHVPYTTNFTMVTNITSWPGRAFVTPVNASFALLTNSVYTPQPAGAATPSIAPYNQSFEPFNNSLRDGFPPLRLYLVVSNSFRFALEDASINYVNGGRLIDFVTFTNLTTVIDIATNLMGNSATLPGVTGTGSLNGQYWQTNLLGASLLSPSQGVLNQVLSSMGTLPVPTATGPNWTKEVQGFVNFVSGHDTGPSTSVESPFVPVQVIINHSDYEVNDPLVHSMLSDITDPTAVNQNFLPSPSSVTLPAYGSIGRVNLHYKPWGVTATQTNVALMDPGMFSSDAWDFPTNKFPNVGWIGRVHRGTPWQTIYLKAAVAAPQDWQLWAGNQFTHPTNDWKLVDLFTTALNDNAASGQIPVNQQGLAAWSAVLSGVIALTNAPGVVQPLVVQPASVSNPGNIGASPVAQIVASINASRAAQPSGSFQSVGQVLQAPGLTSASPFLNQEGPQGALSSYTSNPITDQAYERIPQQILGLIRLGKPRFVVYSYGQSLKPADGSFALGALVAPAAYNVSTNYQITGESAYRTVFRLEGNPAHPNVVIESYTPLAPE